MGVVLSAPSLKERNGPELVVLGGGIGAHLELCRAAPLWWSGMSSQRLNSGQVPLGTRAQLFGAISLSIAAATASLLP